MEGRKEGFAIENIPIIISVRLQEESKSFI